MTSLNGADTPLPHTGPLWSIAVSSNGKLVVAASSDSTVAIWDVRDGGKLTLKATLRLSDEPIWAVTISRIPGSALLAVGGLDRAVRVLNLARWECLFEDPHKLEQEAKNESGLEIGPAPDHSIVPAKMHLLLGATEPGPVPRCTSP